MGGKRARENERERAKERERSDLALCLTLSLSLCPSQTLPSVRPSVSPEMSIILRAEFLSIVDQRAEKTPANDGVTSGSIDVVVDVGGGGGGGRGGRGGRGGCLSGPN